MRQIRIFIAGVELGPFDEDHVVSYFQEGYLTLSDWAKDEALPEWLSLQKIFSASSREHVRLLAVPPPVALRAIPAETTERSPISIPRRSKVITVGSRSASSQKTGDLPAL